MVMVCSFFCNDTATTEIYTLSPRRSSDLGRDEQDVVRLHRSVLGRNGRPLDERQQIALHALAGDVAALTAVAHADLVDLVRSEEHTSELQSRQYLVCRLLLEKKQYRPLLL